MKNKVRLKREKACKSVSMKLFLVAFVIPTLILYLYICIVPMFTSVRYGFFYNMSPYNKGEFSLTRNYADLFGDTSFWQAMKLDLIIILGKEIMIVFFATLFAVSMTRLGFCNAEVGLYRYIIYIPCVLSVVIISTFWQDFFHPINGLFGKIFNGTKDYLYEYPVWIITAIASWCGVGGSMIILIAAINNVPKEMYEAAEIDGAGSMTQLFCVTFPQIKGQITYMVVNIVSSSLAGNMNLILPLYGNSPKVQVMGSYIYYYAQTRELTGYANAAAVILMILSFVICFTINTLMSRGEKKDAK